MEDMAKVVGIGAGKTGDINEGISDLRDFTFAYAFGTGYFSVSPLLPPFSNALYAHTQTHIYIYIHTSTMIYD